MNSDTQHDRDDAITVIKAAGARFGGTFICRDQVKSFTGGALSSRHLANLDSQGVGVPGAFKVGRKQCYPLDSLVSWLISRLEV